MANNVKLILLQDVENLGLAGTEVTVAPGYARNYLIPRGFAAKATPGILRVLAANKEKIETKRREELVAAQAVAAKLMANKDGSVSATSKKNLYSAEQWDQMMDSLTGVVENIANRMKMGDIEAIPRKKKNASPCEHCAFKAVCRNHVL